MDPLSLTYPSTTTTIKYCEDEGRPMLKEIPEDFRVWEVSLDGNCAGGNDFDTTTIPRLFDDYIFIQDVSVYEEDIVDSDIVDSSEFSNIFDDIALQTQLSIMNEMTKQYICYKGSSQCLLPESIDLPPISSHATKESKRRIYEWISNEFPFLKTRLDSKTNIIKVSSDEILQHMAISGLCPCDIMALMIFLKCGPKHTGATNGLQIAIGVDRQIRPTILRSM